MIVHYDPSDGSFLVGNRRVTKADDFRLWLALFVAIDEVYHIL